MKNSEFWKNEKEKNGENVESDEEGDGDGDGDNPADDNFGYKNG